MSIPNATPSKRVRHNYIIQVASTLKARLQIPDHWKSIQILTQQHYQQIYFDISRPLEEGGLSPDGIGRIVDCALLKGVRDLTTNPIRVTGWYDIHRYSNQGFENSLEALSGTDLMRHMAVCTLLAAIWDMTHPKTL